MIHCKLSTVEVIVSTPIDRYFSTLLARFYRFQGCGISATISIIMCLAFSRRKPHRGQNPSNPLCPYSLKLRHPCQQYRAIYVVLCKVISFHLGGLQQRPNHQRPSILGTDLKAASLPFPVEQKEFGHLTSASRIQLKIDRGPKDVSFFWKGRKSYHRKTH